MKTKINYGTPEAEGVPITEQSFSQGQRSPAGAPPIPQDTFVPGVGVLGVDIGGFAKGDILAQEFRLNEHKDARAEESLGIKKAELGVAVDYLKIAQEDLGIRLDTHAMDREKFSWEKDDRQKAAYIQDGMQQAAQQGGYSGVIDFLKVADPKQAIAFHAEKLKLDRAIMKTDVMKALGPNEIGKAKLESYGILGKMFQGVLNAPAADRQNMLDTMQPMLKQVLGDGAPKTLQEALPIGMLAVAQATPENQIFESQKMTSLSDTEIGKTSVALMDLTSKGYTAANNQTVKDLTEHLKTLRVKDQAEQAKLSESIAKKNSYDMTAAKDDATLRAKQMAADKDLANRYMKESIHTGDFLEQKQNFNAAYASWKSGQGGAAAQTSMIRSLGMMFNKGTFSDADAAAYAGSDSSLLQLIRDTKSMYNETGIIKANPSEIDRLKNVMDEMEKEKLKVQQSINERFKVLQKKFKVTDEAINYYKVPEQEQEKVQYSPLELQQRAQEAIAKNPAAKDAILKKLDSMLNQGQ